MDASTPLASNGVLIFHRAEKNATMQFSVLSSGRIAQFSRLNAAKVEKPSFVDKSKVTTKVILKEQFKKAENFSDILIIIRL